MREGSQYALLKLLVIKVKTGHFVTKQIVEQNLRRNFMKNLAGSPLQRVRNWKILLQIFKISLINGHPLDLSKTILREEKEISLKIRMKM